MARPTKIALDYFPFDVDFFKDDKICLMSARFGSKGEIIAVKLLCKIYSTYGYYYTWGEDESLLFAQSAGDGITHSLVNDVVVELAKRGFFNKPIFDKFGILTSTGIQERYLTICKLLKRTVEIKPEWDCTKMKMLRNSLTPEKLEEIPEKSITIPEETHQRKGKETKEKEREWRERTIENELWIEETAILLQKPKEQVKAFCEKYIKTKVLAGQLEIYGPQGLTGFMLKDLEKEKSQKNVANNGTETNTNHGKLEVGNLD